MEVLTIVLEHIRYFPFNKWRSDVRAAGTLFESLKGKPSVYIYEYTYKAVYSPISVARQLIHSRPVGKHTKFTLKIFEDAKHHTQDAQSVFLHNFPPICRSTFRFKRISVIREHPKNACHRIIHHKLFKPRRFPTFSTKCFGKQSKLTMVIYLFPV